MAINIQFLGAAQTVTGSKFLVELGDFKLLVDCGLFQGLKELRLKNWEPLEIDPSKIDAVVLTHAHLDHVGFVPLIVKQGFKGAIYVTAPTAELATIILKDSAKLQQEDADYANHKGFSKHSPALPLYDENDVYNALKQFSIVDDKKGVEINKDIKLEFVRNGHILGSSSVIINYMQKKIAFSGDVGNYNSSIMHPPNAIDECDVLIMESTYGDRLHPEKMSDIELSEVINDAIHKGGSILIPSFAVGRAQEILYLINQLKEKLMIPDVPVYLDTPMGIDATEIFCKYPDWHKLDNKACEYFFSRVHQVTDVKESKSIVEKKGTKIVIAASGMMQGGRVLHYLKEYLPNKRNTVILAGYQSEGTRGRALRSGAHEIKIYGNYYPVSCSVAEIRTLSAHADQAQLIRWVKSMKKLPKQIILVHGERSAQQSFKIKLEKELNIPVSIPHQNDRVLIL